MTPNMPKHKLLCVSCAVLLLAASNQLLSQTTLPAAPAPTQLDQKTLLATTRHAYYLLPDRGVQGFTCAVTLDWQDILERATAKKISAHDPTLATLTGGRVKVTNDVSKGATVIADFPAAKVEPPPGSPVRLKQEILDKMIAASFAGWDPFLSDRILPLPNTRYHFERTGTGYRLTLDGNMGGSSSNGGTFFSILDLDAELRISHGESHLNGVVTDFVPQFDPSSHGWLLTSLVTTTETPDSGQAPLRTAFTYSYQFVGDTLVPKRVVVQVGDGPKTPFDLHDCSLTKTTAEGSR
jgi:hypothetical protein